MKLRRTTLPLVLISIATMTSAPLFAKDAREPALRAAEATRFQAQVDADAKALAPLLDDALEYTHSNGELDSKASFIESLTTGRRDYAATSFDIQSVRILGDVAIIRGTAKVTVADLGNSLDLDLGYTNVWVWKDQRWQMTAWRSARMPPPTAKK
jgi:hypothetical protein